jgi:hypothetical protein
VPKVYLDLFRSNPATYGTPIIGKGSGISFYCASEPMKTDHSNYLYQLLPNGKIIYIFKS